MICNRPTPEGVISCAAQRGYMLLYSLGLLIVISSLVLTISISQRLDTQLLAEEKKQIQLHYLVKGAAEYTAGKLSIASAIAYQRISPDDPIMEKWEIWRPRPAPYQVNLDGKKVQILIKDLTGLPDVNLLNAQDWRRLFVLAFGADDARAQTMTKGVLEYKASLAKIRGDAGFVDMPELTRWTGFSQEMVVGGTQQIPIGVQDLVTVGTGLKDIHIDTTPLVMLEVLGNVTKDHIARLTELRRNGPVPPSLAQQWIQGTGLSAPPIMSPTAVSLQIALPDIPGSKPFQAVLRSDSGTARVVESPYQPR
jgi:hypothetical protein